MFRLLPLAILSFACNGESDGDDTGGAVGASYVETVLAAGWASDMTVTESGGEFSFSGDGLPDVGVLEAYGLSDQTTIAPATYNMTASYPSEPVLASTPTDTPLGSIGVAISGGVYFNPYEGDGTTVAVDSNFDVDGVPFLDTCNGHPLPSGDNYHYHGIPFCITDTVDVEGQHSTLIGIMADGFPVYGPNGAGGTAATGLDECSGHDEATPEFADGVYHYHLTDDAPYSLDCLHGEVEFQTGGGGGPPP